MYVYLFLFITQHILWNDVYLMIAMDGNRFSWYTAVKQLSSNTEA